MHHTAGHLLRDVSDISNGRRFLRADVEASMHQENVQDAFLSTLELDLVCRPGHLLFFC
jgi:hypothetical protein